MTRYNNRPTWLEVIVRVCLHSLYSKRWRQHSILIDKLHCITMFLFLCYVLASYNNLYNWFKAQHFISVHRISSHREGFVPSMELICQTNLHYKNVGGALVSNIRFNVADEGCTFEFVFEVRFYNCRSRNLLIFYKLWYLISCRKKIRRRSIILPTKLGSYYIHHTSLSYLSS